MLETKFKATWSFKTRSLSPEPLDQPYYWKAYKIFVFYWNDLSQLSNYLLYFSVLIHSNLRLKYTETELFSWEKKNLLKSVF